MDTGNPGCLSPLPALGAVQGPPQLALLTLVRGWDSLLLCAPLPPPPSPAMPSRPHCSEEGRGLENVKRRKSFSTGKK